MIPDSTVAAIKHKPYSTGWKLSLANVLRDPEQLLRLLELDKDPQILAAARQSSLLFPLRVPLSYVARMQRGNIHDPLLRQVLPLAEELQKVAGFCADAVGDMLAMIKPGLIQKYQGRVLLVTTSACAIHCRYCFRREFPYSKADSKLDFWQPALDYIAVNPDISEVILSGGDPLTLTDSSLAKLVDKCAEIPHVQRLRIHSRLPVVLPERITVSLCRVFEQTRLQIIHVIHANHAQEIDDNVSQAIARLRRNGELILNQAVLLKGVNDSVPAQKQLSETLISIGVQPYYLHLLDRVHGTHHFEVEEKVAISLIQELSRLVPGYMLPRLVREIAGQPAKSPVGPIEVPN